MTITRDKPEPRGAALLLEQEQKHQLLSRTHPINLQVRSGPAGAVHQIASPTIGMVGAKAFTAHVENPYNNIIENTGRRNNPLKTRLNQDQWAL